MDIRGVLFGTGIGVVVMAVVFFMAVVLFGETTTVPEPVTIEYSDDEIIAQAKKLGMIFIKNLPETSGAPEVPELSDNEILARAEALGYILTKVDVAGENDASPAEERSSETVTLVIPQGGNTETISALLYEEGVIDDKEAFSSFVISEGRSTRLKAGTFTFEKNMDYQLALNVLLGI